MSVGPGDWGGGTRGFSQVALCVCTELSCSETMSSPDVLSCEVTLQGTCGRLEGGSAAFEIVSPVLVSGLG